MTLSNFVRIILATACIAGCGDSSSGPSGGFAIIASASLTGTVTDVNGKPVGDIRVVIAPPTDSATYLNLEATTAADGTYTIDVDRVFQAFATRSPDTALAQVTALPSTPGNYSSAYVLQKSTVLTFIPGSTPPAAQQLDFKFSVAFQ